MAFPSSQAVNDEEQPQPDVLKPRTDDIDHYHNGTPIKFLPLHHVYSATSPCSGSSNVLSKKIKARKFPMIDCFEEEGLEAKNQAFSAPPVIKVYSRRPKTHGKVSVLDSLVEKVEVGLKRTVKVEPVDEDFSTPGNNVVGLPKKRRRIGSSELVKLGVCTSVVCDSIVGPRLRESRNHQNHVVNKNSSSGKLKRVKPNSYANHKKQDDLRVKKWVRLAFNGVDPMLFIGLQCKVYWPLDNDWYEGSVVGYDAESNRHNVKYEDDDEEDLIIQQEKMKFYISQEEMVKLNLSQSSDSMDCDDLDSGELLVLAASLDDSRELEPGDIIWAKLTGHSMWPAVIVDEVRVGDRKGLNKNSGGRSLPVQFFGTHDFARIQVKQIVSFLKGLLSSFHLKCKSPRFLRSLKEAKIYLNEQKLPKSMLHLQYGSIGVGDGSHVDDDGQIMDLDEACSGDDASQQDSEGLGTSPLTIGDLQIISLGEIVRDSDYFQDGRTVWPAGYTAIRKFSSIRDLSASVAYKMEILRDSESKIRPLFRVTVDGGEQFKGPSPDICWEKIFKRLRKMQNDSSSREDGAEITDESGSKMFGLTNPEVLKLIQDLSNSGVSRKSSACKSLSVGCQGVPNSYRAVNINWKDLDRCSVCHMDEEYETNLFLQCDKCRMMVHARCYGEESVDGVLWLCKICRPGAPKSIPPCCLCPVVGGAMKPTTDGRWAHLACAIWIPETCLSDIKRMEPIDGLSRINKDRWKLLCSICGVSYGACIQCSNSTCRVAYHPLCARAAGLCVELEDEDKLHLISVDDDEEEQCIRLLSFCKKHKRPSREQANLNARVGKNVCQSSSYIPPSNPSGCARTEPYDYFGRRGRKEPEVLAAASVKRSFLENRPYVVGGYCRHERLVHISSEDDLLMGSKFSFVPQDNRSSVPDVPQCTSMADKYKHMRETFMRRLTFGKSRIHGFGIFAKQPHRAGDMVIEYTGELVRPSIADRREHLIYNSLVGPGTYMFRVDDERVIDATRAGSIAHLINHSCEPNCYSRVITVNGDEHIIIFAKRDIKQWEELTYDYRFFSIDERLPCYCGFPRCRGIVNDTEAEEQANLYVPCSELRQDK
ncbi:Mn(2+) transporter atx2 [Ancistrocladus abbreviatus]